MINYKDQLYLQHFGVPGMKWGIRRQARMVEKAERVLGRKIKQNDFGGKITNRRIKNVKKNMELNARYKKVKKPGDPGFEWMRGYDPVTKTNLSYKAMDRIIKKLEKNPKASAKTAYNIERGKAVASRVIKTGIGMLTVNALIQKYG